MGKGGGGGAPAQLEPPKTPAPGLPNMPGGFNYSSPYRSQNFGLYPSIAPYQEPSGVGKGPFLPGGPGQSDYIRQAPVNAPGTPPSDMLFGAVGSPSATHPLGDNSVKWDRELPWSTTPKKPYQELFGRTPGPGSPGWDPSPSTNPENIQVGIDFPGGSATPGSSSGKGPFLPGGPGQNVPPGGTEGQPRQFPVNPPGTSPSDMLFGIGRPGQNVTPGGTEGSWRNDNVPDELQHHNSAESFRQKLPPVSPIEQNMILYGNPNYDWGDRIDKSPLSQPSGSGKGPFLPGGPGQNGYMRNNGFWDQMSGSLLDEAQLRNDTSAADAAKKAEEERLRKQAEEALRRRRNIQSEK